MTAWIFQNQSIMAFHHWQSRALEVFFSIVKLFGTRNTHFQLFFYMVIAFS